MPRRPRYRQPGFVYHVTNRGVAGMPIFRNDADRRVYVDLLSEHVARARAVLLSWALLETHYHETIWMPEGDISALVRRIESPYARYFNDSLPRQGYVFQGRYRSRVVFSRRGVRRWVGYNEANIGDAFGLTVDEIARHRWCSLGATLGVADPIPGHDPAATLAYFTADGETSAEPARRRVTLETEAALDRMRARRALLPARAWKIVEEIASLYGVDPVAVVEGGTGPGIARARAAAIRACRALGATDTALAQAFTVSLRTLQRAKRRPEPA